MLNSLATFISQLLYLQRHSANKPVFRIVIECGDLSHARELKAWFERDLKNMGAVELEVRESTPVPQVIEVMGIPVEIKYTVV